MSHGHVARGPTTRTAQQHDPSNARTHATCTRTCRTVEVGEDLKIVLRRATLTYPPPVAVTVAAHARPARGRRGRAAGQTTILNFVAPVSGVKCSEPHRNPRKKRMDFEVLRYGDVANCGFALIKGAGKHAPVVVRVRVQLRTQACILSGPLRLAQRVRRQRGRESSEEPQLQPHLSAAGHLTCWISSPGVSGGEDGAACCKDASDLVHCGKSPRTFQQSERCSGRF